MQLKNESNTKNPTVRYRDFLAKKNSGWNLYGRLFKGSNSVWDIKNSRFEMLSRELRFYGM